MAYPFVNYADIKSCIKQYVETHKKVVAPNIPFMFQMPENVITSLGLTQELADASFKHWDLLDLWSSFFERTKCLEKLINHTNKLNDNTYRKNINIDLCGQEHYWLTVIANYLNKNPYPIL